MQISAYHKTIGDTVGFDIEDPDIIYVSCIFDKNASLARGIKTLYPDAEVILGGSGFYDVNNLTNANFKREIPVPAQKIKPDYSLYPKAEYDLGFTTRGVSANAPFVLSVKRKAISTNGSIFQSSTTLNTKLCIYSIITSMRSGIGFWEYWLLH